MPSHCLNSVFSPSTSACDEGLVLRLVHRAVDVVLAGAAGADLVVARLEPADIHVDRVEMDDRRDGVEEGQRIGAGFRLRSHSASDGAVSGPVAMIAWSQSAGGRPVTSSRAMVISGCAFEPCRHRVGKAVAVDGQRAAGRHLVGVAGGHDQRAGQPHFGMQQADRVGLGIVGAEGVGADEFGQAVGLVRVGAAHRAHFMQDDRHAGLRRLPCGFRTGEAAADDVDRGIGGDRVHSGLISCRPVRSNTPELKTAP